MKFFASICALSAVALAAQQADKVEKRQIGDPNIPLSVELVLFTALPSSLLQLAITDQAAASSVIASEFAAGTPPAWFQSLPSDVQTYLIPAAAAATTTAAGVTIAPNGTASPTNITTAAPFPMTTGAANGTSSNGTLIVGPSVTRNGTVYINGTVASTRASNGSTVAATGGASGSASGSGAAGAGVTSRASTTGASASGAAASSTRASSSSSHAGAAQAVPTGVISAGLAGLVAIAGVLAL